jgi:hypothetical protein
MRIAWSAAGSIFERVVADSGWEIDVLAGLEKIGIDEISHRRGQRYIAVVIDHDSGRLVWAVPGRDRNMAAWIAGPAALAAVEQRFWRRQHEAGGRGEGQVAVRQVEAGLDSAVGDVQEVDPEGGDGVLDADGERCRLRRRGSAASRPPASAAHASARPVDP